MSLSADQLDGQRLELSLSISRREVLRYLGYPRSAAPRPQIERELSRWWEPAQRLLRPCGLGRVVSREAVEATGMPRPTERVGIGLCTVGPRLDQEIATLQQRGQMLEALILDAVGSAAAEAAADQLNAAFCEAAQQRGLFLPPRVSPGYGKWAVEGQRVLIPLLEGGRLGISLSEGLMMTPRKSVSFAVRFEDEPTSPHRRCSRCRLENCAYRDEEF